MPFYICPNCKRRSVDSDGYEGFSMQAVQCRSCGFGFLFELLEDYYPAPATGFVVCDRDVRVLASGRGVFELTGFQDGDLLGNDLVQALSLSDNGTVSGPMVLAGYGIVLPEGQGFSYDSYAGIDVKDKIVLVLRYAPEGADAKLRHLLARYSALRYKAMAARQRGAKALLVVSGPSSPNAGETIPMTFDTALSGSGIVAASISGRVANSLLGASGRSLGDIQRTFDTGNPHATGFDLRDVTVTLKASVVREQATGSNIVAYLPATASTSARPNWQAMRPKGSWASRTSHTLARTSPG